MNDGKTRRKREKEGKREMKRKWHSCNFASSASSQYGHNWVKNKFKSSKLGFSRFVSPHDDDDADDDEDIYIHRSFIAPTEFLSAFFFCLFFSGFKRVYHMHPVYTKDSKVK